MILRLLLAVILAGALVAASMPMIETAQRAQVEGDLELAIEDIEAATGDLRRHSDPVPLGVPSARRTVSITIPPQASDAGLTIGPSSDSSTTTETRLLGTAKGKLAKETVLETPLRPIGPDGSVAWNDSVTLRDSADLTLRYRTVGGRDVITVARVQVR